MHDATPIQGARVSLGERLLARIEAVGGAWVVAGIATLLALPGLAFGFATDDRLHAYFVRLGADAWSLFAIAGEQVSRARNLGTLAWWSSPDLSLKFFRPLSALTHMVDYSLWPQAAWLMHLESGLLYAAIVALAWFLYREFVPARRTAALAALMFAIDEGHAPAVGWIANRNTLLANLFAFSALLLHVRSRRVLPISRGFGLQIASAVCLALALCSGETGVCVLAYFGAYALVFEHGPLRKRIWSLLPALFVAACWSVAYVAGGFGASGSGYYRDPGFSSLLQGILDLPTWLLSLLGPSVVNPLVALPAAPVRLVALVVSLPLLAALFLVSRRSDEDRFFALGALLSLPPLFSTLPQDRLLIATSLGTFGLLAGFVTLAKADARRGVRVARRVLIGLHLVIAPLMFPLALSPTRAIDTGVAQVAEAIRERSPAQVVLVNLPIELLSFYVWNRLGEQPDQELPSSIHQLYAGSSEVVVERIDPRTLEVRPARGWGERPIERVFGSISGMPREGGEVTLGDMRLRVEASAADGRPMSVQFRFTTPLESPGRLWLVWRGRAPVPWQPPPLGQRVVLPALSMFTSLSP